MEVIITIRNGVVDVQNPNPDKLDIVIRDYDIQDIEPTADNIIVDENGKRYKVTTY